MAKRITDAEAKASHLFDCSNSRFVFFDFPISVTATPHTYWSSVASTVRYTSPTDHRALHFSFVDLVFS
jgi:hypothetical protein